jgi:hypothetical protein
METDPNHPVFGMMWGKLHALYVTKVERKGRDRVDLDHVLCWLTGRSATALDEAVASDMTLRDFIETAPAMNPARDKVTGVICGVRIEEIDHPLMKEIRIMDKLVDELARGRAMEKILRT